jgi:hypothetical protein
MNPTQFELTVLNAQEVALGIAGMAILRDLIQQGDEADLGVKDRSLPRDVRAKAMKESRHVNQTISLLATIQETNGISA